MMRSRYLAASVRGRSKAAGRTLPHKPEQQHPLFIPVSAGNLATRFKTVGSFHGHGLLEGYRYTSFSFTYQAVFPPVKWK